MEKTVLDINRDIIDDINHGIILTDLRGHIIFWNRACEKILGYREQEILYKPIRILYADDEVMPFKKIMAKCIEYKDVEGRWHALHKNQKKVWLEIKPSLLKNSDGTANQFLISIYDIGKLIKTESKLKKNMAISQAIFDSSADAMITVHEKGTILTVNRSALDMFGYSKKELIGKNIKMLMSFPYNVDYKVFIEDHLKLKGPGTWNNHLEIKGKKKDGTVFPIDLTRTEVIWEGHRIFAKIIKDISARRNLEKKILETGEKERKKIGSELHDGLGQMLTGIRMMSESLARKFQANALPGYEEIKEISSLVQEADEYARSLSRGMVQIDFENKGLSLSLENLCKRISKMAGIQCDFNQMGNFQLVDHNLGLHLYRIAQEAVNNAIKHGKADYVSVRISSNEHHTALMIDDNGVGFSIEDEKMNIKGAGLQIMKHRATLMGGVLELVRSEDGYTKVRCVVPNNLEHF